MNLFEARDALLKKVADDRHENTVFLDGIEEGIHSTLNFIIEGLDNERKATEETTEEVVAAAKEAEGAGDRTAEAVEEHDSATLSECVGPCGCGC